MSRRAGHLLGLLLGRHTTKRRYVSSCARTGVAVSNLRAKVARSGADHPARTATQPPLLAACAAVVRTRTTSSSAHEDIPASHL